VAGYACYAHDALVACQVLSRGNNKWRYKGSLLKNIITILALLIASGCASTGPHINGEEQISGPALALFTFYDKGLNHLSAVRSGSCSSHPSCSAYSRDAFKKHGLIIGWWMTYDRLIRCGRDEVKLSPRVLVRGKWKTYDPLSNNDFWWYDPLRPD
jgi:putative component of membrane protein insertase Oxa1/YidC/SpoIIIJ protein YidD